MRPIKLIIIIFLINNNAYSQQKQTLRDKFPIKKHMDSTLYNDMLSVLDRANKQIYDTTTYWFDLFISYSNRFVAYTTLSNDSISEKYWFEAYNRYPENLCQFINNPPKRLQKANPFLFYNIVRKKEFYDSCCAIFYNSLDSVLIKELKEIEKADQLYREKLNDYPTQTEKKYYWKQQAKLDSINLIKIDEIFKKHGYPGRNKVGIENEDIMFLVIQHSNLKTMEKYLPYLKKAIEEHNLFPKYYAYLKDRINMIKGIPQIFGTQLKEVRNGQFELYKIKSMYKIDDLRATFGLESLKDYLQRFGIKVFNIKK